MNYRKNFLTNTSIDYRILKTPLEVIKPNEHHMRYGEYRQVLKTLSRNLYMILDRLDDIMLTPEDFSDLYISRAYVRYYIESDLKLRNYFVDKYKQKCDELTKAFFSHTVVCSLNYNTTNQNIML